MKLIIVEGNISAGKSTLCKALGKELNYHVLLEPVLENPFLAKYYGNPKKYALPMQIWLLKHRYKAFIEALTTLMSTDSDKAGVILDRSIYSDWVFAEQNYRDGNFSESGYKAYLALRRKMLDLLLPPHMVVYLNVEPSKCQERIVGVRKRSCESGIPLAYLEGLHSCYTVLMDKLKGQGCAVFDVDWNNFGSVKELATKLVDTDVPEHIVEAWTTRSTEIRSFIANPDMVLRGGEMDVFISEAVADDVQVEDPLKVFITDSVLDSESSDGMDTPVKCSEISETKESEAITPEQKPTVTVTAKPTKALRKPHQGGPEKRLFEEEESVAAKRQAVQLL